jgi:hypothetical protein
MKISLANPFGAYIIASVSITLLYALGFSDLYPSLSLEMITFLIITCGTSLVLTSLFARLPRQRMTGELAAGPGRRDVLMFGLIACGFVLEFAYSGFVPLIALASGAVFDYREFGVPTFHVVLLGVNFFYAVYWASQYFETGKRGFIYLFIGGLLFGLLIMNRGAIIIALLSLLFMYFANNFNVKKALRVVVVMGAVVWLFGFLGNLRFLSQEVFQEDPILAIGGANKSFTESGLPNEFFWVYLYATSPLANFELTASTMPVSYNSVMEGMVVNLIPDFISKHMVDPSAESFIRPQLITPQLTVATAFASAYANMGWLGPYLIYAYFVAYTLFLAIFARNSRYRPALMAWMSAQGTLLFFDNMLVFSGAVGPILIGVYLVIRERLQHSAGSGQAVTTGAKP